MDIAAFGQIASSKKWIVTFLILTTFLVYANTFFNDWTYDDFPVIVNNADIHDLSSFFKDRYSGRPIRELTYILDFKFFGLNPAGYHFQQNLWHALNGVLVFFLLTSLGITTKPAIVGSAFFLFHPLQVESVANISHRKEILGLLFSLSSCLSFIYFLKTRKFCLLFFSILSFILAYYSNQTSITIPAVMFLYYLLFCKNEAGFRFKAALSFSLMSIFSFAYLYKNFALIQKELLIVYSQNNLFNTKSFIPLWISAFKVFSIYFTKIFFPFGLAPEYNIELTSNLSWSFLFGIFTFLCLIILLIINVKKFPILSFGIGWFLILYFPVSNILPIGGYIMADRYMYIVLPGLAILISWAAQEYSKTFLPFSIMIVFLCLLTIRQNTFWKNSYILSQHSASVNPTSIGALLSASQQNLLIKEYEKARVFSYKLYEINRFHLYNFYLLGKIEEGLGNYDKAFDHYSNFLRYAAATHPQEASSLNKYLPFFMAKYEKWKASQANSQQSRERE